MWLAMVALLVFAAGCVGWVALGAAGLWVGLGPAWAVLALAALALFRFYVPLRLGVLLGAVGLLGWPWFVALIIAVPRLVLMLPGYASMLLARARHPRPVWTGVREQKA
ncbi:MAG TPA: hypothetical protein VGL50_03300 [Steroidobacteraceae bacterium]|jgi:hypothetical protein